MEKLDIVLSEIFKALASFFGTTVECVTTNAPHWLKIYGLYATLKNMATAITFLLIAGYAICGVIQAVHYGIEEKSLFPSKFWKWIAIIGIGVSILYNIPGLIVPELAGVEALVNLVQRTTIQ